MKRTIVAAVVGICLSTANASAEPAALIFDKTTNARDQNLVITTATKILAANAWEFRPTTFSPKEIKALLSCTANASAATCTTAVTKKKAVARVAIYSLGTRLTSDGITETVISARLMVPSENIIVATERYCDHCTDDTVVSNTLELTQKLISQLAVNRGRTILALRSVPTQAGAFLDGESIGATDLKTSISPGPHLVRVESPGYRVEERKIVGLEGKTTDVVVTLVPDGRPTKSLPGASTAANTPPETTPNITTTSIQPQAGVTPSRRSRSMLVPKLLVGVGVASMISGGVLMWLDGPDTFAPRDQQQERLYYQTMLPGGLLLGGGAIAVAIGSYLLLREPKSTTLIAAPTQGGAVIGLIHGF